MNKPLLDKYINLVTVMQNCVDSGQCEILYASDSGAATAKSLGFPIPRINVDLIRVSPYRVCSKVIRMEATEANRNDRFRQEEK